MSQPTVNGPSGGELSAPAGTTASMARPSASVAPSRSASRRRKQAALPDRLLAGRGLHPVQQVRLEDLPHGPPRVAIQFTSDQPGRSPLPQAPHVVPRDRTFPSTTCPFRSSSAASPDSPMVLIDRRLVLDLHGDRHASPSNIGVTACSGCPSVQDQVDAVPLGILTRLVEHTASAPKVETRRMQEVTSCSDSITAASLPALMKSLAPISSQVNTVARPPRPTSCRRVAGQRRPFSGLMIVWSLRTDAASSQSLGRSQNGSFSIAQPASRTTCRRSSPNPPDPHSRYVSGRDIGSRSHRRRSIHR